MIIIMLQTPSLLLHTLIQSKSKPHQKRKMDQTHKPHCLILPYPVQGHINPMIQFSKRLAHKGLSITFALTQESLLLASAASDAAFPASIAVEEISDGGGSVGRPLPEYLSRFREVGTETLSRLLDRLTAEGRIVDCIVYDAFLPWGLRVARERGLVGAAFFTQSCCVNVVYYNIFKGKAAAGLPALEAADLPSFVAEPEKVPGALELLVAQFEGVEDAHFVFVNSVYELEEEAVDWLGKFMPMKTIGPTIPSMYLDKRLSHDKNYGLSMFKPIHTCMKWLQNQQPKSVIYVSFGSMAELEEHQMEELAIALRLTNRPFLWVVRSSEESKLPRTFAADGSSGKGLVVSWCPQLEVLAHEAVGCFITHCGWNSTLEALSSGVPMVGMLWWSDQSTNIKLVMDVWKVGVRARPDEGDIVGREELVRCVEFVMGEEEMRENARKWKELAKGVVDEGGSSNVNIQEFVSIMMMRAMAPK